MHGVYVEWMHGVFVEMVAMPLSSACCMHACGDHQGPVYRVLDVNNGIVHSISTIPWNDGCRPGAWSFGSSGPRVIQRAMVSVHALDHFRYAYVLFI